MILEQINSPDDVKKLPESQLDELASELRDFIISSVAETGGHLAPNLGVVELTIGLHRVFRSPIDKIVWDVGHQAYIHKILTGRKERFCTLRQYGGISGFPKISESEYDAFGVGHSSTSISAALGLATARDLCGQDHKVVAVIGDGALSGGIAFEGLNNAGDSKRDVIVVLNDNRMSISPNVGALSRYLTSIITNPFYNRLKKDIWNATGKFPKHSTRIREMVKRIEEAVKSVLVPGLLFERLGFRYVGPVNGHDIPGLIKVFGEIKRLHGPILVHVLSTKGKGYKFAEDDSTKFHGLGSFCRETGDTPANAAPSYTEIFGKALVELAAKDKKIVGITAAMAHGTGLIHLARTFKDRFFDVGIAEQHAVTFGCGLALEGFKPVIAIYSTFLQRAYDQVIHDAALQNIPIKLILDRGGLVGADGPTHHGSFDLSYLRLIPGIVIMTPKDENELRDMLFTAMEYNGGPVVLRYPRGQSLGLPLKPDFDLLEIGKAELLQQGKDLTFVAAGDLVQTAMQAADLLKKQGLSVRVINARFIKPLDSEMILTAAAETDAVVTLENNSIIGGLGGAVAELISENGLRVRFRRCGLPDRFVTHGAVSRLFEDLALDAESLASSVRGWLG